MSDRLDDRIRELYSELADAAPDLPPLPAPRPARSAASRRLVLAGGLAVTVLVIGVGIGLLSTLDIGSDDSAALDVPATRAPDTAAPAAPDTTGGAAAEEPGEQGTPRPVERILLLADLNRACTVSIDLMSTGIGDLPENEAEASAALSLMFDRVEALRLIVEDANADLDDSELLDVADRIIATQGPLLLGGDAPVLPRYADAAEAVAGLGVFLAEFGATDCSGLGSSLP